MYSYGHPRTAGKKQDDQLEHTYRSYVRIRDIALKTCQKGVVARELAARHDDDEDDMSCYKLTIR